MNFKFGIWRIWIVDKMECGEFGRPKKKQNSGWIEFLMWKIRIWRISTVQKIGIWTMHIPNLAYSIFWAFQIVQIPCFAQLQILDILFFGHSKV